MVKRVEFGHIGHIKFIKTENNRFGISFSQTEKILPKN